MTLKIEQIFCEGKTRIRLSGQLRSEHLGQLKTEIARHGSRVALDLEEVELVDLDGIRFLNECESGAFRFCTVHDTSWNGCCRREADRKTNLDLGMIH